VSKSPDPIVVLAVPYFEVSKVLVALTVTLLGLGGITEAV